MKQLPNSIKYSRFWISIVNILGFLAVYATKPKSYSFLVKDVDRAYSNSGTLGQLVDGYIKENGYSGTIGDVHKYVENHSWFESTGDAAIFADNEITTLFFIALAVLFISILFSLYLVIKNKTYDDKSFSQCFKIDLAAIIAAFVFAIYKAHSFISYGIMILFWIICWLLSRNREKKKYEEYEACLQDFNEGTLTKEKIDKKLADLKLEMKETVSSFSFKVMTGLASLGIVFLYNYITVGLAQNLISSNFTLFIVMTFIASFAAVYLIFYFFFKIYGLFLIANQKSTLKFFYQKIQNN